MNQMLRVMLIGLLFATVIINSCASDTPEPQNSESAEEIKEIDITGYGSILLGESRETIDLDTFTTRDWVGFYQNELDAMGPETVNDPPDLISTRDWYRELLSDHLEEEEQGNLLYQKTDGFQTGTGSTEISINVITERFKIVSIQLVFRESVPDIDDITNSPPIEDYKWIITGVRSMLLDKYDISQITRDDFQNPEGNYIDKALEISDSDGDSIWFGHGADVLYFRPLHLIYLYRDEIDNSELDAQIDKL